LALRDVIDGIFRARSFKPAHFRIADERVLDEPSADSAPVFTPEESYFSLRLSEMRLRDEREYWQKFTPLASALVELQFAGGRHVVPAVVGPQALADVAHLKPGDHVEHLNRRLAGPLPYLGDDVSIFFGLFRIETDNWARRALSLLQSVGTAFDFSKLTTALDIAGPLTEAVQGLLGMEEVGVRLALNRSYSAPSSDGGSGTTLRPGYEVMLRRGADELDEEQQARFWVKAGQLHHGDQASALRPYDDADFVLLQVAAANSRGDYTTFDFHTRHWPRVQDHIWAGRDAEAKESLRLLAADLVQSEEIVRPHRWKLLAEYRRRFDESVSEYREMFDSGDQAAFEDARDELRSIGEPDLQRAVRDDATPPALSDEMSPEAMMARLAV
jgi:hypothetical protein